MLPIFSNEPAPDTRYLNRPGAAMSREASWMAYIAPGINRLVKRQVREPAFIACPAPASPWPLWLLLFVRLFHRARLEYNIVVSSSEI
jgi:hypothetical protein